MSWWRPAAGRPAAAAPDGPRSYAEWSGWFDAFAAGGDDEALIARAGAGALAWSAGTAERLAERAAATLGQRLNAVTAALQAALGRARSEGDVTRAMLDARRSLGLLDRYAALSCWPETLARQLRALVGNAAADLQRNLLRSAVIDRSGRLTSALQRTPLDRIERAPVSPVPAAPAASATGRRILL